MRAVRAIIAGAAMLTVAACGGERCEPLQPPLGYRRAGRIRHPADEAAGDARGHGRASAATPGGTNRADPTPEADAFAALGGNAEVLSARASSGRGALVRYASRYGVDPAIRQQLAIADDRIPAAQEGPRCLNALPT